MVMWPRTSDMAASFFSGSKLESEVSSNACEAGRSGFLSLGMLGNTRSKRLVLLFAVVRRKPKVASDTFIVKGIHEDKALWCKVATNRI